MKRVLGINLVALLLIFFFLASKFVLAQYPHTCACTPDCTGSCALPACSLACTGCDVGSVDNLSYSGNGTEITLNWDAAQYATSYDVNVLLNGTSITDFPKSVTETTTSFTGILGNTYTWTVLPRNVCDDGTTATGPIIGIPNVDSVTLAYNETGGCIDSGCNGEDIIVGQDIVGRDQRVPIRVTATDGNGANNIENVYVLFDNNSDYLDGTLLRVKFTNSTNIFEIENGSFPYTSSEYPEIIVSNGVKTAIDNTLTLDFILDFSALAKESSFLSNIYVNVRDQEGISTGRVLKVGQGNFERIPADPYSGNAVEALDIWNGRDVAVKNVGFYQVDDFNEVCNQVSGWNLTPASGDVTLDPTYVNNLWDDPIVNWNSTTVYQPYYYYNGIQDIEYSPYTSASIILTGMSAEQYGGDCVEATDGVVTNNFKNGGVRYSDSGVGDDTHTLETAFSVIEISSSWSRIIDGSLFSGASFDLGIEPSTCQTADCVLMDVLDSGKNGLLLVNGDITAKDESHYGSVENWYAKTQSGINPFNNLEIDKNYDEIKGLFAEGTFTELTADSIIVESLIGTYDLSANETYFVNGNLTIADNSLSVNNDNYLLFVVNGNLVINKEVTNTEAMFIVLGNITILDNEASYNDVLNIEGALVASGSIHFGRSLYVNNNTAPAVTVRFRPDMLGRMKKDNNAIINLETSLNSQL